MDTNSTVSYYTHILSQWCNKYTQTIGSKQCLVDEQPSVGSRRAQCCLVWGVCVYNVHPSDRPLNVLAILSCH